MKPQKELTFITAIKAFRTARAAKNKVEFDAVVEAIEGGHRIRLDDAVEVELRSDEATATRGDQRFGSGKR